MIKAVLLKLLCICIVLQFSANLKASSIPDNVKEAAKARVDFGLSAGVVIGHYKAGKTQFFSYGETNRGNGISPNEQTIFEVGSISKVFTASLLASAVNKKNVELNQSIFALLPENCRSEQLQAITMEMLATHHAGLLRMPTNYTPQYYQMNPVGYSLNALCDYLSQPRELAEAGRDYNYSNLGMGVLAHLLEITANESFADLMLREITSPLGMGDTSVDSHALDQKRIAQGHHGLIKTPLLKHGKLAGAGAVLSTAQDLMIFMKAIIKVANHNRQYFLKDTLSTQRNAWDGTDIALGWHIQQQQDGRKIHWHNGSTGGFHSFVGMDVENKEAVVILANSGGDGNDDLGFHLLDSTVTIKPPPNHKEVAVSADTLANYVGLYDTEFGLPIDITHHNGQLKAQFGDQFALNLYPSARSRFFYRAINAEISFKKSDSGAYMLFLHQDGESYPAKLRQATTD